MHSNVVTTHGDGIVVNHHTLDHFVVCNKNIKMTSDITFAQLPIVSEVNTSIYASLLKEEKVTVEYFYFVLPYYCTVHITFELSL